MDMLVAFFESDKGVTTLKILAVFLGIYIVVSLIKKMIPKYILGTESRYKARKMANMLGYILLVLSILFFFSKQMTGITVFLGVAGAGIAFALQEVITSIAGYIIIHSSSFYSVGDRVMVGGIKGDVVDIGLLRTSLMEIGDWVEGDLYNGRITRVANSFIFSQPVHNYSAEFPFVWDELKVPVKTSSEVEYGRAVFYEILRSLKTDHTLEAQKHWDKMTEKFLIEHARVDPMVTLVFDENWITFTLRYVVDFKSRRSTKDVLSTRILEAIKASEGKLEVASAGYEITAFPSLSGNGYKSVQEK